ncbi:membrane protein [Azorhizobium oxalatiphilum]|uniref:Membrane protein n=1 Tax=Azorhizobium oxalatiphilum TaxID=980631 RepID=A0A917CJD0_9HYPH|nr:outer membrane protein [Azorhizobium oxalatiphilum]GGF88469.1 membrane protein [Azorhizobium oxalatiphilum]
MKPFLVSGVLASALFAAPAMAADMARAPVVAAPIVSAAPPVFSWTGFYIGANAGYAWGSGTGVADSFASSPDGWLAGGQVGYNYQFQNNMLIGLEADVQAADIGGGNAFASSKMDSFGTVRARLGYAFDRVLPYVTGGFAWGNNKITAPGYSQSDTLTGWTAGAGVEYALTNNWTARAEYLYTDFGKSNYDGLLGEAGLNSSTARLGVNYKF